MNKLET